MNLCGNLSLGVALLLQSVGNEVAELGIHALGLEVALLLEAVCDEVAELGVDTLGLNLRASNLIVVSKNYAEHVEYNTYVGISHRESKSTCREQGGDDEVLHDD